MSLPNDDDDDLVTKRDLRTEIGALRGELRAEVARIDQRFDRLDAKIDDQGHRHGVMLEQILATVPSAVVPSEWNCLINPAHADIRSVTAKVSGPFRFDSRLRP